MLYPPTPFPSRVPPDDNSFFTLPLELDELPLELLPDDELLLLDDELLPVLLLDEPLELLELELLPVDGLLVPLFDDGFEALALDELFTVPLFKTGDVDATASVLET